MRTPRSWLRLVALSLLAGLLLAAGAACSDDNNDSEPAATATEAPAAMADVPDVTIGASEYAFDAPATLQAGLTHFNLVNSGVEDHQALFIRLNDGVTLDDLASAPIETEADVAPYGTLAGGPIALAGGEFDTTLDLEPGSYVLICTVETPDGVAHADLGMVTTLDVTEPPADPQPTPETDVTVTLSDFAFDAPDTLPAGETTFDVVNAGQQIHEMGVIKLDDGATIDDMMAAFEAESEEGPFAPVGALYGLSGGQEGWTTIDLTAGTYALVCFVTDPESGMPHVALGMVDSFTVE